MQNEIIKKELKNNLEICSENETRKKSAEEIAMEVNEILQLIDFMTKIKFD